MKKHIITLEIQGTKVKACLIPPNGNNLWSITFRKNGRIIGYAGIRKQGSSREIYNTFVASIRLRGMDAIKEMMKNPA